MKSLELKLSFKNSVVAQINYFNIIIYLTNTALCIDNLTTFV